MLSQILGPVVAGSIGALIYSRKAACHNPGAYQLIIGPFLTGGIVLALTNLLCMIGLWLAVYADYRLFENFLIRATRYPDTLWVPLALFNAFALLSCKGLLRWHRCRVPHWRDLPDSGTGRQPPVLDG